MSVDAYRSWLIALGVKAFLLAVENVIRGNRDESRMCFAGGSSEVFRSERICLPRFLMIAFTTIDIGPRRTINHGFGAFIDDY